MAKVLIDKYPLGSLPNHNTAGRYMEGYLKDNIDIMAKKIVDDMQFLGLISTSTFEVRSGKSTLAQQIGEYYTDAVNKLHGLNLTFGLDNITFSSKEFIEQAFKLPKYSVLIMDENDEVDEHYFSKLAKDLRVFFKKSGQLNLFCIIITPNFFQLRPWIAIGRSNFLIDVKFTGEFERGYFSFYNFPAKQELYVKGKKEMNYHIVPHSFGGKFLEGYVVDKKGYLAKKKKDLNKMEETNTSSNEKELLIKNVLTFHKNNPNISSRNVAKGFGISQRTYFRIINDENGSYSAPVWYDNAIAAAYPINTTPKGVRVKAEGEEGESE